MLIDEMVPREAGKGFQLYGANKVKAQEHAEWVLLRECVFEDLVIILLVVNDGKESNRVVGRVVMVMWFY